MSVENKNTELLRCLSASIKLFAAIYQATYTLIYTLVYLYTCLTLLYSLCYLQLLKAANKARMPHPTPFWDSYPSLKGSKSTEPSQIQKHVF